MFEHRPVRQFFRPGKRTSKPHNKRTPVKYRMKSLYLDCTFSKHSECFYLQNRSANIFLSLWGVVYYDFSLLGNLDPGRRSLRNFEALVPVGRQTLLRLGVHFPMDHPNHVSQFSQLHRPHESYLCVLLKL